MWYLTLLKTNLIPDCFIRAGIKRLLRDRLELEQLGNADSSMTRKLSFIESMSESPLAIHTKSANERHYEVPTDFYLRVLGRHLKYSSCLWEDDTTDLTAAEEAMLSLTVERADIRDGMKVLELGCGWGSLSLYMAKRFPNAEITAVSNSRTQKEYIDQESAARGISNLNIITADMNEFQPPERNFDRVVSVEMFEHMRNYELLLNRISGWLKDDGRLFVHIFVHDRFAYPFETDEEDDWMARYFFTGGLMPSYDIFNYFTKNMEVEHCWKVNGRHYEKTLNAWLAKMDSQRNKLTPLFRQTYKHEWRTWWVYWRIFFMACAELFGYQKGNEWFVGHYLLKPKRS